MTSLALTLLISLIAFVLFTIGTIWYVQFLVKKIVGEKHGSIEEIMNSGEAPRQWSMKYDKKNSKITSS